MLMCILKEYGLKKQSKKKVEKIKFSKNAAFFPPVPHVTLHGPLTSFHSYVSGHCPALHGFVVAGLVPLVH